MGELRFGPSLGVWLLFVGALFVATASAAPPRDPRPRSIRGFKNVALSTARGFGKRSPQLQEALQDTLPADWFAEELAGNPELARLVIGKFIDTDGDGLLTPSELLRPLEFQRDGFD